MVASDAQDMLKRVVFAGVQVIGLLALNDDGAPMFNQHHAAAFAALDIPVFACPPTCSPT